MSITIDQRTTSNTVSPTTPITSGRSTVYTNNGRPRITDPMLQGINAKQVSANRVPTQLAHSEFQTSPCISSEKLVVMPHDGQGNPVDSLKEHGGSPSCRCVSIVRA